MKLTVIDVDGHWHEYDHVETHNQYKSVVYIWRKGGVIASFAAKEIGEIRYG